jgi:signal transduction histidine kinase
VTEAGSLRIRLLFGAILLALGLIAVASVITIVVVNRVGNHLQLIHGGLLAAVGIVLIVAGVSQFRRSFSPVARLRDRLADVREGRSVSVDGDYPSEVGPLVDELNALLDDRETSVRRALAKAGDLAHGLKTPLAVLSREAERARATGQPDLADSIEQQVQRMRRQVTFHLAHARAAASGARLGARTQVGEAADGLSRALGRLHADRDLAIDVEVDAAHAVRCEREDLDEMLGNLLDNACRWARSRVRVSSRVHLTRVVISVDDDGPGLQPSAREAALRRGVSADESGHGSGLGLAIVRDLAELYGGTIELSESPMGGLGARLDLPAA